MYQRGLSTEHGDQRVNAAHGLLELYGRATLPPELGQIVRPDDHELRYHLVAGGPMAWKSALIAVDKKIEECGWHIRSVEFIEEENILAIVVVKV